MPRGNIRLQDVAQVFLHYGGTSPVTKFIGCMNTVSIAKTMDTEDIRCGLGWGLSSIMYSNPDMTLTFTPAYWEDNLISLATGEDFKETSTVKVWFADTKLIGVDGKITISKTAVPDTIKVVTLDGEVVAGTLTAKEFTATTPADLTGKIVNAMYQTEYATADVMPLKGDTFPTAIGVSLYTHAYDINTNEIVTEHTWQFDRAISDSSLNLALAGGTNNITEVSLRVLPANNNEFGKYIVATKA